MRMQRTLVLVAVLGVGVAGCTGAGAGARPPAPDDCGAAALQERIGQPVAGRTAEDARVGGEPVASRGNVRVVAPGEAVTMDFNPNRLTIETNAEGQLARAQCT